MKPCKVAIPNKKYNHNAEQLNFVVQRALTRQLQVKKCVDGFRNESITFKFSYYQYEGFSFFFYFSLHYCFIALSLYSMVVVSIKQLNTERFKLKRENKRLTAESSLCNPVSYTSNIISFLHSTLCLVSPLYFKIKHYGEL